MRLRWRLVAGLGAAALVASACGGGTEPEASESPTAQGSTPAGEYCNGTDANLVWAHEQEPPNLHVDDPANNQTIASWILQSMLDGLYGISASTEFFPELLADEMAVTENEDGSVTFVGTLRAGLMWSDGEPLTADDVVGTFTIIMEGYDYAAAADDDTETKPGGTFLIGDRSGYDLIDPESMQATSDTEFTFTMSSFFAGYRSLFERILPTHVLTDAETANALLPEFMLADGSGPLPSSGPMTFGSWEKGVAMHLVRNDGYHGSVSPDVTNTGAACVSGVDINFVKDTDAQINALKTGEADMIFTQPQVAFKDRIAEDAEFTVASEAGPVFEHWGMNLLNKHLKNPLVREAIAYALDKGAVMTTLYTPLFGENLLADGLGNTYWLGNQSAYVDHQAAYNGAQIDMAKQKLEDAGYTLNGEGIYEHPELGALVLRVGTTGGNKLRELQQQIIQAQMKAAGIQIEIDNVTGSAYFNERPFSEPATTCAHSGGTEGDCEVWDITQFAWVGGPWPGVVSASYRSDSGFNPYGFSNAAFDAKADVCDRTIDPGEQADCYNELDRYVTTLDVDPDQGLFMLPITQKPSFYAFSNVRLSAAAKSPDADDAGPLVNVMDFVKVG